MGHTQAFVGLDVHKDSIAVAIADGQPGGEVRFWGNIENSPERVCGAGTDSGEARGAWKRLRDRGGWRPLDPSPMADSTARDSALFPTTREAITPKNGARATRGAGSAGRRPGRGWRITPPEG